MAVAERMKNDGLLVTRFSQVSSLYYHMFEKEVENAVISLLDTSAAFSSMEDVLCAISIAISGLGEMASRALDLVLRHAPSREELLEAIPSRFYFVTDAAGNGSLKTLQRMHEMLPLLPDGSGRRGELMDYHAAIVWAAGFYDCIEQDAPMKMEYLAEQAGYEEIVELFEPHLLFYCSTSGAVDWFVNRAPWLVEGVCKLNHCLYSLVGQKRRFEHLVRQMVELVDREVLCAMIQQPLETQFARNGWCVLLKPIHEAVPECMDGLRWTWLMHAIKDWKYDGDDVAFEDVVYMAGMCTREDLLMRDEYSYTAYDMAALNEFIPQEVLDMLKVEHLTKGAHA